MIDLDEYSKFNKEVDKYPDSIKPVIYILGLMAELGEFCNMYKKVFRDHGGQLDKRQREYALELGDIEWYFERLAASMGYSLEEIITMNMEKLQSRKERHKIHGEGDFR